jgi:dihydrolipoamide dehydrogenase
MSESFDLIVIGAGPAGYVASIKAAQLGMKVACVEKRETLGGTCLNVGCIPSKALLESSHLYKEMQHAELHGIKVQDVTIDVAKLLERKNSVVEGLTKGIAGLFAKNKVTWLKGAATIKQIGVVEVAGEKYNSKNILIASGSEVINLPNVEIDEKTIISSTGALNLPAVPNKMVVIGGGYIGLEMATVWRRLGAEIEVVEYADSIVPAMDLDIRKEFKKILEADGFKFRLQTKVLEVNKTKDGVAVKVEPSTGGASEIINADIALIAIGRKPYTEGLGLHEIGVLLDERGRIKTDAHFQTNVKGIYAVGDAIAGPMLAHKAEEEAVACVEIISGQKPHINYDAIPSVVYTNPEVASVGKTEDELKAIGASYKVGKFPFLANSRGRASGTTQGFVKILADSKTDKVLGVHIIGANAGTMIAEAVMAIEFGASSEDIARTCHAHPTLNEAVKEAALATFSKAIHI